MTLSFNMKGTAKSKVVTSGRLSGRVKAQPARRRVTPNPGPTAGCEPAYSLYSTDSEDQVKTLHKGLDRCAALLDGILQAEKAEATPCRALKGEAARSRPTTSLGKKTIKKQSTQTAQRSCPSVRHGPGNTTPRATHQSPVPAAHSGVKLHPPQKQPPTLLQSHFPATRCHTTPVTPPPQVQPSDHASHTTSSPQPQTSILPPQTTPHSGSLPLPQTDCQSAPEAPHTHCRAERDGEEGEFVPVKDNNAQTTAARTAVRDTHTQMSDMQLEPGQPDKIPQDTHTGEDCSAEVKVKTVPYLLGELKALITGQGSVAERLLSHLEQTVMNVGSSHIQTEPDTSLHSQNIQLRRRVRILHQQLNEREKAGRQQNIETLCNSEVFMLQEELITAQFQLQELQDDLLELRRALQDTQSQLRDREAENALIKTDLEATRGRLLDSEREKSELASLAQQRLEEINHLKRTLQIQNSSDCPAVAGSSVSETLPTKPHFGQHQQRPDPAEHPVDRITQYLMSLGQLEPTQQERACVAAEREGSTLEQKKLTSVQLRNTLSHPDVTSQRGDTPAETSHQSSHHDQSHYLDKDQVRGRRVMNSTLSQCDVESAWSDWSMRSGSTFDTRDEAAFRDGLSALDASIASLQKTIQLDLGR